MTLRDYLQLFRRGWLVLVSLTLLGVAVAMLATASAPRGYNAQATVEITVIGDGTVGGFATAYDLAVRSASAYAARASTDAVVQAVAAATGDDPDQLRSSIGATARTDAPLIDVFAFAGSGELAAQRANALADELAQRASTPGGPEGGLVRMNVVAVAEPPSAPSSPRPVNNVAIGLVLGLAAGVGAVVVGQALDTRVRGVADLPRDVRFASLTSLPAGRARAAGQVDDQRLEAFRLLRANLEFSGLSNGVVTVAGVTAAADARAVADQLARVLAEISLEVVVVDLDLRVANPRRRRAGEADPGVGIADVLSGRRDLPQVVRPSAEERVSTVGPGAVDRNSAQLLSTAAMGELLEKLNASFHYVLLSCPPVVDRSESAVLAAQSGGVLLVAEAGRTNQHDLLHALELLGGLGVRTVSLALDHVRRADVGRGAARATADAIPSEPEDAW